MPANWQMIPRIQVIRASLYLPNITQQSAVERFNEWIDAAPGLKERLLATGMNPRSRRYTPAQVRLIVEVLEEP